ncbi:hypothetical protein K4831_22310 (plasmid) [Agrobacterium vitis]|nr:hypothetical protein [Agrobacterium vitis]QZO06954.1 hypothetical protein K4831_22310 [Agrobacterium vitis]UJL91386.1 hypothetical protein AVF2S5_25730 [Agrobacterium vitis]
MSRPVGERIELRDGLDLAVIEFVARKDAELVAGPEKRDRDHKGAGKLEGVVLCEGEICVHRRAPSWSGPFPLDGSRQCPEPVAITAKAKPSGRTLA